MDLFLVNTQFHKYLKENIDNINSYDTWFKNLEVVRDDEYITYITVPNSFIKKLLMTTHRNIIKNAIHKITNTEKEIELVTNRDQIAEVLTSQSQINKKSIKQSVKNTNLNPKYTFDNFIIGENNRFAHAACLAASERPAKLYNPIFIYGGVGLGKTHLMHSIGHHYSSLYQNGKILYISSETFTNELINSIQTGTIDRFRQKYRNIDLLLIDDIQFLENKEKTQDEFFHTFNALKDANKQIVITSDSAPNKLNIEKRLTSRFGWGLITDISQPDFETRIAILRKKAQRDNFQLPDFIYPLIAGKITSNIRELEGALLKVDAFIRLSNTNTSDISEEFIDKILRDITSEQISVKINEETIKNAVASFYGIRVDELNSKRRTRNITFPRHIAMYLIREMTDLSLPKIGNSFGGKDHTTVMHACDKISIEIQTKPEVKQVLNQIKESIENGQY